MAEFKTQFSYGGVSTWRPGKGYDPARQHRIVRAMFGNKHPDGAILLPDGSPLWVEPSIVHSGYTSIALKTTDTDSNFALRTPTLYPKPKAPMLVVKAPSPCYNVGEVKVEGFLPEVIEIVLVAGKRAMTKDVIGGPTARTRVEGCEHLAQLVMASELFGDPDDDISEGEVYEFDQAICHFLGDELSEVEAERREDIGGARSFENYVAEISGRFGEIIRVP